MLEQKIIWTVLPNGIINPNTTKARLKFSVFVSPRLGMSPSPPDNITKLGKYPDFETWTEKVRKMKFKVKFSNGEPIVTQPDTTKLDDKLWSALFNENTIVRPYTFREMQDRVIRTYPVSGICSYIKKKYIGIAENSPGSLPLLNPRIDDNGYPVDAKEATLESVINDLGELLKPEKKVICSYDIKKNGELHEFLLYSDLDKNVKQINQILWQCPNSKPYEIEVNNAVIIRENDALWSITDGHNRYFVENTGTAFNLYVYTSIYSKIDQELSTAKVLNPTKTYDYSPEQLSFLQAKRFYSREEEDNKYMHKPNAMEMLEPIKEPEIDFHQMHAILGDHPELMRMLAFVLDFEIHVPKDDFTAICVRPIWSDSTSVINNDKTTTWTHCIVDSHTFMARPKPDSNIQKRMLDLTGANDRHMGGNTVYDLVQIDPDGASLQMLNTARSLQRQIKRKYLTNDNLPSEMLKGDCMPSREGFMKIQNILKNLGIEISDNAKIDKFSSKNWIIKDKNETLELQGTESGSMHIFRKMNVPYDTPEDAGLPSLRTAGIALTKSGRAFKLHERFIESFSLNNNFEEQRDSDNDNTDFDNDTLVYADELVRGYRVDILDESISHPEWRSLCEREGTYSFPGTEYDDIIPVKDEEGYVKGASATSKDDADSDLYFHETVFRWNGWSLCAQRPGKTVITELINEDEDDILFFNWDSREDVKNFLKDYYNARWVENASLEEQGNNIYTVTGTKNAFTLELNNDQVIVTQKVGEKQTFKVKRTGNKIEFYAPVYKQKEVPGVVENKSSESGFSLESNYSAKPKSLPKLRFGHWYRLRARIVDLAGNSLKLEMADNSFASDRVFYMRFEPLAPPTLVPRAPFTEGESLERMVIRSNFDQTGQEYVKSPKVKAITDSDSSLQYKEGNERHVVPPKTSQLTAETHGEFDKFIKPDGDYKTGYNLALKEKGTLFDDWIVDTATGEKTIDNRSVYIIPGEDVGEQGPGEDEGEKGQYIINKAEQLILPYLPDPISRGASLRELPGIKAYTDSLPVRVNKAALGFDTLKIPFNLFELNSTPFRIRIIERPGKMTENSLELSLSGDNPPKWDNKNRLLTIYIAKAEETNVRYSCYFNEKDMDKMGILDWLKDSVNLDELKDYALSGCHWMLTPYRKLTLVHAVQQPLCKPEIYELEPNKFESNKAKIGDTFTRIKGEIGLNTASTEKIEMLAQWTEQVDDLAEPGPDTLDVNGSAFVLNIDRSDPNKMLLPPNHV